MEIQIGKQIERQYPRGKKHIYIERDTLTFEGERGKAYLLVVKRVRDLCKLRTEEIIKTDSKEFRSYIPKSASSLTGDVITIEDWLLREKPGLKAFRYEAEETAADQNISA